MAGNIKNGLKLVRMNNKEWVVYLVRCADESLYCGITKDVEMRLAAHNSGKGAKYTKSVFLLMWQVSVLR